MVLTASTRLSPCFAAAWAMWSHEAVASVIGTLMVISSPSSSLACGTALSHSANAECLVGSASAVSPRAVM